MKCLTTGMVSTGWCSDGEIGTKKELQEEVLVKTKEYTKKGGSLDFGMREPDTTIHWSGLVWKLVK